jgi:hypothetical protein
MITAADLWNSRPAAARPWKSLSGPGMSWKWRSRRAGPDTVEAGRVMLFALADVLGVRERMAARSVPPPADTL